jgi:transposase
MLEVKVSLGDALPPDHLARFIVELISQLDLSPIYQQYSKEGAPPYAPELLLGLIVYGYATGVFSSRKIERATHESIPFRFIAGNMQPDHDTVANFRKQFLGEIQALFVQVLLVAQEMGYLSLGNISLDGSKIHADASKSKAVSYKRLLAMEAHLQAQVGELFALAETADSAVPEGMVVEDEIAWREERLARLAEAKAVLEARAQARYEAEQAEYEEKLRQREEKAAKKGQKPRGQPPKPPTAGPRDKDQYNFTDPESRIMKNANNDGFDQHYNVQVAVDQDSRLIVAPGLSNHTTDRQEALPTVDAIPAGLGRPEAAALDNGYWSPDNVEGLLQRGIEPYIATGRDPHHGSWQAYFQHNPQLPAEGASAKEKMAHKLRTVIGRAIYRLRKSTVEPVIGIIKEVLGFRQFSLRGLSAAAGEWVLVCLAFNLKRLHTLHYGH